MADNAAPKTSLIKKMADQYGLEATTFKDTIVKTLFPSGNQNPSNEQVAAFLVVADQYNLNPFIKEIYAFPGKGGGIVPIVSIDGWTRIINRESQFDGLEFIDEKDENDKITAITVKVYRKDRSHPIMVTEYMSECKRDTEPWKKWPTRMLRHKALIQAARYAFGLAGIYDQDEAERIAETTAASANAIDAPSAIPLITEEQRTALVDLAKEVGVVEKLGLIVTGAGFEMLAHITVDKYAEVEQAIRDAAIPDAEIISETKTNEPAPVVEEQPTSAEASQSDQEKTAVAKVVEIAGILQKKHNIKFDDLAGQFLPEGRSKFSELTE